MYHNWILATAISIVFVALGAMCVWLAACVGRTGQVRDESNSPNSSVNVAASNRTIVSRMILALNGDHGALNSYHTRQAVPV
jgi:hypothetical protein